MHMGAIEPRFYAALVLAFILIAILLACRFLAARSRRPAAIWGAGGYWALLHLFSLAGLLASAQFASALAQITLFTFPFSVSLYEDAHVQGFSTLPDLGTNYVRYILCFGGMDAMLIAAFLVLVVPARDRATPPGS